MFNTNKKDTMTRRVMWWNLPPEEIDELRDTGQLQAFTCVEYNDDDESRDNNETNHIQQEDIQDTKACC